MKQLIMSLLILSLTCCGGGGSDGDTNGSLTGAALDLTQKSGATDSDGKVTFNFSIMNGATSFQIAAVSSGNDIKLTSISDSADRSLLSTAIEHTDASSAQVDVNTFNYPTLTSNVRSGTYSASYQVTKHNSSKPQSNVNVSLSLVQKADPDESIGTLPVNVIYVGPVSSSQSIADGVEKGVEILGEMFARANIALNVRYYDFDGPADLPDPRKGSSFYRSVTNQVRDNAINILLGRDVKGLSRGRNIEYAIAGGQPAAVTSTSRSVGVISILEVTGNDGLFDDDKSPGSHQNGDSEVRLLAEEMAHLAGRMLGLSDAVTFDGDDAVQADSLSDTESCVTLNQCENESQPRENFMFPLTIRIQGERNKYYARDYISPQQSALMHRSPLMQ